MHRQSSQLAYDTYLMHAGHQRNYEHIGGMHGPVLISMAGRTGAVGRDASQALTYSGTPCDFALPRQHLPRAGARCRAAASAKHAQRRPA